MKKQILKKTEKEFLKLTCSQLTYKQIAAKMKKSPRTIDGYRDELFHKLKIKTRTGLILYSFKKRIIKVKDINL